MKIFLAVLFVAICACLYYFHNKPPVFDPNKSEPVKYTKSLQNDVKKADDVQQKMNTAVSATSQEVDKAVPEAEPK